MARGPSGPLNVDLRRPSLWHRITHPFRTRVGWWLAAVNGLVVGAVLVTVLLFALDALRDLMDRRDRAQVLLAGVSAREDIRRTAADVLASARVLGERPTLLRLLGEGRPEAIRAFAARYCTGVRAFACSVERRGLAPIPVGAAVDWNAVATAAAEQGERFYAAPATGPALLGAVAAVPGTDTRVLVIEALDEVFAAEISRRLAFPVRLRNYRGFEGAPVDGATRVHLAALADGESAVEQVDGGARYVASVPLFAASGEPVALIEVSHSAAESRRLVDALLRNFVLFALLVATAAVLSAVWLGRRVTGPIESLTESARRIGVGDYSATVAVRGTNEVAVLGRTIEEMRRGLLDATATLRRREAEAQAMLQGIVEGLFAVDLDRRIRYLNPQAARLLGVEPADAVGRFCGDVLRPVAVDGVRPCDTACPILEARARGVGRASERLQRAGGESRTMVITSSGAVDALQVQVIRDETDLEAVRRARDSVLAHISHEFRTPLAGQQASLEMLHEAIERGAPPGELAQLARALSRGTLRLTQLIDNLLESVRIESGHLSIRHRACDLADILDEAAETVSPLLDQRGQRLQKHYAAPLPLTADPQRLTQVFVNLLANAAKFSPDGSAITLGARTPGDSLEAWVDDEGPGIAPDAAGTVFDRFPRGSGDSAAGDASTSAGLGLGLWISRSIILRHGGSIVVSRSPAGLNRLAVTLPREPAA